MVGMAYDCGQRKPGQVKEESVWMGVATLVAMLFGCGGYLLVIAAAVSPK
jgi:hypothetical protein